MSMGRVDRSLDVVLETIGLEVVSKTSALRYQAGFKPKSRDLPADSSCYNLVRDIDTS